MSKLENSSKNKAVYLDGFVEVLNAKERIKDVLRETNLIYSETFSNESGNTIYIKPENLQTTGSFKIRGAYNKISKLSVEERKKGLISSSAGNHAQGVAYAAKKLGVKATIVMPKTTPLIKVEATKKYGAEVVLFGDCYDEAFAEAKKLEKENNFIFIHPFNDLDVITGQGTVSLEILEELKDVDCILVPIGGGGLISGVALAAKKLKPSIKIIGVEPEGAMAMKMSMDNNRLINLDTVNTIADGVAVKYPGDLTFSIIMDLVDEIVTVSDFEIMESFLLLLEKHKLIAESAGVLSLAGLKKLNYKNKNIVCIVSGGNIDVLTVSAMIDRGLVSRGRLFCFSVDMPDKPGELVKISTLLSKTNANIVKLDHNQFKTFDRFNTVQLEVTVETNGHEHILQISKALEDNGFNLKRIY
ncbi:MAG: threonine ammonia-lyase [Clostridiaceae bacterium]|nr:threonine ammonia-lyase [Clostridiaceae bacterium]